MVTPCCSHWHLSFCGHFWQSAQHQNSSVVSCSRGIVMGLHMTPRLCPRWSCPQRSDRYGFDSMSDGCLIEKKLDDVPPHAHCTNATCTLLVPLCVSRHLACPQPTWPTAGNNGGSLHSAVAATRHGCGHASAHSCSNVRRGGSHVRKCH